MNGPSLERENNKCLILVSIKKLVSFFLSQQQQQQHY